MKRRARHGTAEQIADMYKCGILKRPKPKRKSTKVVAVTQYDGEPMSKRRLFDNADAWLDDEPWRKW